MRIELRFIQGIKIILLIIADKKERFSIIMKKLLMIFIMFCFILPCHAISNTYLLPQAQTEFNNKQYEKCIDTLNKIIESSALFDDAVYLRAKAYYKLGDYDKAIIDMSRSVNIKDNYEKRAFMAHIYARVDNKENIVPMVKQIFHYTLPEYNGKEGKLEKFKRAMFDILDDNKVSAEMKFYSYRVFINGIHEAKIENDRGIGDEIYWPMYMKYIQFVTNMDPEEPIYKEAIKERDEVIANIKSLDGVLEPNDVKGVSQAIIQEILLGLTELALGNETKGNEIIDNTVKVNLPKLKGRRAETMVPTLIRATKYELEKGAPKYGVGLRYEKIANAFYITEVIQNSPADIAGLKPGMKILSIYKNGKRIYGNGYGSNDILPIISGKYNDRLTFETIIEQSNGKQIASDLVKFYLGVDTSTKPKEYTMRCKQKIIYNGNIDEDDFSFSYKPSDDKYGIGIGFGIVDDYPVVKLVEPNSPAAQTNKIKEGTKILEVNNVSTKGKSSKEIADLITGPANTVVTIKVQSLNNPALTVVEPSLKEYTLSLKRQF